MIDKNKLITFFNGLAFDIHQANLVAGWYDKPAVYHDLRAVVMKVNPSLAPALDKAFERNEGEMFALFHSELSEGLEGIRKNLMDDHLPHRPMAEVELADVFIRILDYAGKKGYDIGGAMYEKLEYNKTRADHKRENRAKPGGKAF